MPMAKVDGQCLWSKSMVNVDGQCRMSMVIVMVKIMSKFLILKARIEIWTSGGRKITCGVSGVVEQDEKEEELCFLDKYICLSEKRYFFCTKIFFLWKSRDICFFLLKRKCCEKLLPGGQHRLCALGWRWNRLRRIFWLGFWTFWNQLITFSQFYKLAQRLVLYFNVLSHIMRGGAGWGRFDTNPKTRFEGNGIARR